MAVTGLQELRRVWIYIQHKKMVFHPLLVREAERIGKKQGNEAKANFMADLEKHWWKHQGKVSLYVGISMLIGATIIAYLVLT